MKTKLGQLLRAATLTALAAPITLATGTVVVAEAPYFMAAIFRPHRSGARRWI